MFVLRTRGLTHRHRDALTETRRPAAQGRLDGDLPADVAAVRRVPRPRRSLLRVTHVRLSDADMREFAQSEQRDPAIARFYALQRELAEQRGGLVLELWKLLDGRIFGLPWMMTSDEAASRLGISRQDVHGLAADFSQEAMDAWAATPEYRRSPYRVMHERRAQGLPPLVPGERPAPGLTSDDSRQDGPPT